MNLRPYLRSSLAFAAATSLIALSGCNNSANSPGGNFSAPGGPAAPRCAAPLPVQAMDYTVTVNVPSDLDATASPAPTPTTDIHFSILLPERCPGDSFPLVLHSHGYSGSRESAVGPDGSYDTSEAHFPSINTLIRALPYHDYVVISYDERGHGASRPAQAQHNARAIDPAAETQDAIALLDWAFDYPALSFVQTEPDTGISKDIRVGTIGYSYGGGFEMPLALLDERVDTIVPNGTWNNLLYSLLPGDAVKLGFDSLLCTLALQGNVNNTPLLANLCNLIGPTGVSAVSLRTRADLVSAATLPTALPRPAADGDELLNLFYTHGTRYFEKPSRDGKPIPPRDTPPVVLPAMPRAVPALFIQGNRDTLFNLTDAYFNYRYFKSAGADVRLLSTEGGHMNPLALQSEGTANCGAVAGLDSILAWFDQKLKGLNSSDYQSIPQVCISVTDTPAPNSAPDNASLTGLLLDDIPVGSLSGTGAVPATVASLSASVPIASANVPVFAPITSITAAQAGAVLAGIPRASRISISAGAGSLVTPVAYVGVGIRRGSTTILVDDEVTPFAALPPDIGSSDCPTPPLTDHCHNRSTGNSEILLPGVGEQLQVGDQVGLLFYENHVQYLPVNTVGVVGLPNPYTVTVSNPELPIVLPCPNAAGCYAGSQLSIP